ncbi:hypothetical protein K8R32_02385 [bacterium]|nr:hypothetical protein [bacterium]
MPNGKKMNKTDLPEGAEIKVGEKFCISKTKFFTTNGEHQEEENKESIIIINGHGPFLLLGIRYFSKNRHSLYFFRFEDDSGIKQKVNKMYCSKYSN